MAAKTSNQVPNKGLVNLPTMQSGVQSFLANNPQFGKSDIFTRMGMISPIPSNRPSAPTPGMTSYVDDTKPTTSQTLGQKQAPVTPTSQKTNYQTGQTQSPKIDSQNQNVPPTGTPGVFQTALNQSLGIGLTGQGAVAPATSYLQGQATGQTPAAQDINALRGFTQSPTPEVQAAQQAYNQFAQSSPYMQAAQYNPNVAADIASGRSALLGQTFSQELAARQQAINNAIAQEQQQIGAAGTAGTQALTGQAQQIGAAGTAGQLGLGAQGQQITATGNVLGAAAPVSQFGVLTSPVTGQPISPGTTPGSAAFQGGQVGAQQQAGATYQNYVTAQQQGQALGSQLNNVISQYGINPSDINAVNKLVQAWAANTSNPQYQTFNNLINDLANRYAQVLTPAGGNVTDMVRSIVSGFINASASGQSINQVLNALDNQATAVINATKTASTGQQTGGAPVQGGTQNDPLGIL